MELELIQAPTGALLQPEELVSQARVDGVEERELLVRLLAAAMAHAEKVLQRSLLPQRWRLTLDGFPVGGQLRLPRGPLLQVLSVKYLTPAGVEQVLAGTAYRLVGAQALMPRLVPAVGQCFPATASASGALVVEYQCGFAAGTVPEDIRHAVLMLAAHWYEHREAVMAVADQLLPVPMAVESLLAPYVAHWVV